MDPESSSVTSEKPQDMSAHARGWRADAMNPPTDRPWRAPEVIRDLSDGHFGLGEAVYDHQAERLSIVDIDCFNTACV
jgi:hypothetical protein